MPKALTLLAAIALGTALTQCANPFPLPPPTAPSSGGVQGECTNGFCGTPSNNGGSGPCVGICPGGSTVAAHRRHKHTHKHVLHAT